MTEETLDIFINTVIFIYAIILGKFLGAVTTAIVTNF